MAGQGEILNTSASGVIDTLARQGWCVMPGFLPAGLVSELRAVCLARHEQGGFHAAGVGAGTGKRVSELRRDQIQWLESDDPSAAVQRYLSAMEDLRQQVNRELYLGLHELEAHFAVYPAGAFYKRHVDRFRDDDRRTLTAIVYLNEHWSAEDGGQLRLWSGGGETAEPMDILPVGGTLVTFLADRFPHEVLSAMRNRLSLTGWFKRR